MKTDRRRFMQGVAASAPLGLIAPGVLSAPASADLPSGKDYFAELGVPSFINAIGPYSSLGGARMWPEVIDAMDYAIRHKARMSDLHDAVGRRIAELTGAEAAMVTAGATCAMIQGVAACMTGSDPVRMERLPDTTGMPNEIILQKGHRYLYDRSLKAPGAKLVVVETASEIRAAISEKTAMLFFLLNRQADIQVPINEFVAIGKEHDIPVMCDAATTVPPIARLFRTVEAEFDLVCFSGGKGLRGPYSAGLLLGRKDLVRIARQHGSPNHRAYGRSMKVSAEEYLGMMVAVEKSLSIDEQAEYERQRTLVLQMGRDIEQLDGLRTVLRTPDYEAREPYIEVHWSKARYPLDEAAVKQALRDGDPCIEVRALFLSGGRLELTAAMLRDGEAAIVAQRVRDILAASA